MKSAQVRKISAVVIGLTVAGSAIAWGGHDGGRSKSEHHMGRYEKFNGGCGMGRWLGRDELMARELSAEQIQTLAEARLIMMGNENLKVGTIKTTEDGYSVSVVTTKSGDLVRTMELAKNGLPMQMVLRMEEREERRGK